MQYGLSSILEMLSYLAQILGIPVAILVYRRESRRQQEDRLYGTYDALDDKYIELQQQCLEYPTLDVGDSELEAPKPLSELEEKQAEALLLIRISIYERAYLMYRRHNSNVKNTQWPGWEKGTIEWAGRKNFRKVWDKYHSYFDTDFSKHYQKKFLKADEKRAKIN